jgi:hypothetical protein
LPVSAEAEDAVVEHEIVADMGKPKGSDPPTVHALKPSRVLVPANWVHAASAKYCTTPLLQLSV